MNLKNYQVGWIIAQALLSDSIAKLTSSWELLSGKTIKIFKSILNALTQSMHFEIFSYIVYKETNPIIYNIGKINTKLNS